MEPSRQRHAVPKSPPGITFRDGEIRIDPVEWPALLPDDLLVMRVARAVVILYLPDVEKVQIGTLWFPREFWMLWDPADAPRTALNIRIENGAPVAQSVTVIRRPGEPELTTVEYRKVNLRRLVLHAAGRAAGVMLDEEGNVRGASFLAVPQEVLKENLAASKPGRGNRVTDEFLEQVATIYREAVASGDPPLQTVAARLNGSYSSAGRWVVSARRARKLGPAKPGQRGEMTKPKESQ